ncbi:1-hydroxycarotenoid 3,4-desaturase CrtD [Williamwhitmania taraxaci]|uniref:Phytoene desaturase n=1 Tax=Williamwhitmania taraxaci TaxID=1640674 RepID=A0A1G6NX07_9BACT|nr:1-hydroxycarotenoid 3,4-desaturase CrtD [Williamwhitmania taraxaci]SDC72288.1 phytoene desaturase [Williamwhitmania taraxaci]
MGKLKIGVVGSGVAGMASAIRMAIKGFDVHVYEQSEVAGGKLNQLNGNGYRFDTGPSLFTLPQLLDDLFTAAGKEASSYIRYNRLDVVTRYFYPDGSVLNANADPVAFADECSATFGEPAHNILNYLKESKLLYELTANLFIFSPFPTYKVFSSPEAKLLARNPRRLRAFTTMHQVNVKSFADSRIVQLFDRYATYNGSNPYKAPGTLTMIPHLEHNVGAFFPEKGMRQVSEALEALALDVGVTFHFSSAVGKILTDKNGVTGLLVKGEEVKFDAVVNDTDIFYAYPTLLPEKKLPWLYKQQEPSTSALIFYWGVKTTHPQLELHNILFSENYRKEFEEMERGRISTDPTVYLFISSKQVASDAPAGCENWFTMINVPPDTGQNWPKLVEECRVSIQAKIKAMLGIDLKPIIEFERVIDPPTIARTTSSFGGSLYGISSNGMMAAFSRHPNHRKSIPGLYFVGGSVHPGGGIPLCLASAKIVDDLVSSPHNSCNL